MTPFIGYVYELYSNIDSFYYIGSTVKALNIRFAQHKYDSKHRPNWRVYRHFNAIGWQHIQIRLIMRDMFASKEELHKLENDFLIPCKDDEFCLNSNAAYLTQEEKLQYDRNRKHILINCKYCNISMKRNNYYSYHRNRCCNQAAFNELPFMQPH